MKEHREESYRCAAFVKRNHFLKLLKVTKLYTGSKKLAKGYEDEKTLEYIHERGHERVRGGYYAQSGVWDQLTRDRLQKGADYLKGRPARRGCKQGSMIL
jgi:hypothetical protein